MKKGNKPIIVYFLIMLIIAAVFVLLNVGFKLKNEELTRIRFETENMLKTEQGKKINLTAEYQTYSSEQRIVLIATDELGMVRRIEPVEKLLYSKEKLEEVNRVLKQKYD
ncbi:MAG: hypothetical protein KGZ85_05620 [Ignavibacterium sp.]|nr:hypothetical protein [Ignavibacterium sp.]